MVRGSASRSRALWLAVAGVAAALGCSDDGAGRAPADASGGASGASSGGSSGSSGSSGTDADAADAEGGTSGVAPIYPVAVGYSWTYDVVPLGAGDNCGSGSRTTTVVRQLLLDGRDAFELDYFCSTTPIYVTVEGDRLYYYNNAAWQLALDTPVEEGRSWQFVGGSTRTWLRIGPVNVPAGAFTDCWEVHQEEGGVVSTKFTYCRGAGLVLGHFESPSGDGSDATLTSKNF